MVIGFERFWILFLDRVGDEYPITKNPMIPLGGYGSRPQYDKD
jgi:hypothetical protein